MSAYEVDAAEMCDALSHVAGVQHVLLEFDGRGNGILRVQVAPDVDQDAVVAAAVISMRHRFGLGVDASRLRLTGPSGRPVIAVVEVMPAPRDDEPEPPDLATDDSVEGEPVTPSAEASGAAAERRPPRPRQTVPAPVSSGGGVATMLDAVLGTSESEAAEPSIQPIDADNFEDPEAAAVPDSAATEPPEDPGSARSPGRHQRVVVERIEVATERHEVRATVGLRRGESSYSGSALGTATPGGSARAVATATARALEAAVGSHARLDVEAVDLLRVGSDEVGVVVLTLLTSRGIDRLTGSALVRGDGRDTVVRATLDALNRRAEAEMERAGAVAS